MERMAGRRWSCKRVDGGCAPKSRKGTDYCRLAEGGRQSARDSVKRPTRDLFSEGEVKVLVSPTVGKAPLNAGCSLHSPTPLDLIEQCPCCIHRGQCIGDGLRSSRWSLGQKRCKSPRGGGGENESGGGERDTDLDRQKERLEGVREAEARRGGLG